jgi:hypothetical protein
MEGKAIRGNKIPPHEKKELTVEVKIVSALLIDQQ